jgi:non-ribosomal peptide synthase protein (TIGR01720 family)
MLQLFLAEPDLHLLDSLKRVICSGEALPAELAERCLARLPQARLENLYGPTEASVDVSWWSCQPGMGDRPVPIGRPIQNCQLYVLDHAQQPVPVGVSGELYIGGVGLARGYLRRPDLTAASFVPNPFPSPSHIDKDAGGGRLYRTGDLARWLPDGSLEYLGRRDHQVKIRGFRVELGEIEAALVGQPSVREAVVLARPGTGGPRLVAYLVADADPAPGGVELRAALKQQLPEYMLPAAFVFLPALPLTPNGKLDSKALPDPQPVRLTLPAEVTMPRSDTEARLARIWTQVIHLDQVGIHDNFFELGGDSIQAIQIVAKINQEGFRFTPRDLFRHQTIAELAALGAQRTAVPADQGVVQGPVPLTPIQRWFFDQALKEPGHWNQALLVEVPPGLDARRLESAVQRLLAHHDALRLRFQPGNGGWQQANAGIETAVPFDVVDLSITPSEARRAAIEAAAEAAQASLDLTNGPLMRVTYFDLGPRDAGRLSVVIHHLAVDGISWRILMEDLRAVYQQLQRGEPVQLPPKTASFAQWAERLVTVARSGALDTELAYWLTPAVVRPVPVDGSGDNSEASARTVSIALDQAETHALLQEVPAAYRTTVNDVLLTALTMAMARWSGEPALLLDLEGHGREELVGDLDVSRTVGWFTAIFPVLLAAPAGGGPGGALKTIKETLRAVPGKGVGYGLLRYLSPDPQTGERLARLPQPQVIFNYAGRVDDPQSAAFRRAAERAGSNHASSGARRHVLEISAVVADARLQMSWTYSENLHQAATIERLAQAYRDELRTLIAHCLSPGAGGYTPSDFPSAGLDQRGLDELIGRLTEEAD